MHAIAPAAAMWRDPLPGPAAPSQPDEPIALPADSAVRAARARPMRCRSRAGRSGSPAAAVHRRGAAPPRRAAAAPPEVAARLAAPRAPVAGLSLDRPRLMARPQRHARQLLRRRPPPRASPPRWPAPERWSPEGADILDIGGESHPPRRRAGAARSEELARVIPVIEALRAEGFTPPISIDTRKAAVARAAFGAGADLFNDVSALDPRPGEPRPRRRLGQTRLPDARPGRPAHDAGRPRLRRRAARRRRLPRGPRRRRRGRRHPARPHPRRPGHRLRQDRRRTTSRSSAASRCCTASAAPSCSARRASASSAPSAPRRTPPTGSPARSPSRSRLCARARR